ncbi:MAG: hypothetical protein SPF84_06250, partial [Lachnospiraceae bacterium]|nr:hypothetical protein [Lachnospiraceae bacterium]
IVFLRKFIENTFYKFLTHSYAGVGNLIAHGDMPLICSGVVAGLKGNAAAVLCKFDCVAENVYQYFPDKNGIGKYLGSFRGFQICM